MSRNLPIAGRGAPSVPQHTVAQVSKPAVAQVSKPAAVGQSVTAEISDGPPTWKSATQQTRRSALLPFLATWSLAAAAASLMLTALTCQAAERILSEWTYDRPGDLGGWQPNAHLTNVVVTNGCLSCRAVGDDPILELRPLLSLAASPRQVLEVRLKADRDGTAEWFWSNTTTGRYGGFTQEKTTRFPVRGDGRWHTYRVLPCWHPEERIVRLRFDLFDGAQFELDSIRIAEFSGPPPTSRAEFDFAKGAADWQWLTTTDPDDTAHSWEGARLRSVADGFLLGPPVHINTTNHTFASLRMSVDRGHFATLFFVTDGANGLHSHTFMIEADGRQHTYNLDLRTAKAWRGSVLALGLRPSDATNASAVLHWLKLGSGQEGPADLRITAFLLENPLPRVGLPSTLTAVFANTGGEPAANLEPRLSLPSGLKLISWPPRPAVARLGLGEQTTVTWKIEAEQPVQGEIRLTLTAANAETVSATAPVHVTPRLSLDHSAYVPEPKPVRGPFEVGAYYFPGWKTASQWQPIQRFPERRPVLGWYREGDPEVADWHIKWAVEHGITFLAYDWYWDRGGRQLEHALHDGYFKARYRHLLKFCLLWANHNPPHTSSHEDCLAVTRYWIENYFRRPEHLTLDGKPVVIIFSPHRLSEDLGSEGVKRAFDAMRAECVHAGLKGLYLIACVGDAGGARHAAAEGYDAVTAYNWPGLGMTGGGMYAPFSSLIEAYGRNWEHLLAQSPLPLRPLPLCGGWDSRPWHGENNLVRFGRTPRLFKQHLLDAKRFLDEQAPKSSAPKAVLVEAWNEWGEGSYIEPHSEFGFGYLDAIREVFTGAPAAHDDVTPADVGLAGRYDLPPTSPAR